MIEFDGNNQIIILNHQNLNQNVHLFFYLQMLSINIYYSKYVPINIERFKKKKLLAFAGIGNPENFFSLLKKNKLIVKKKISFPDHYKYTLKELNELIAFAIKNNLNLITTEKDFFRIKHFELSQIQCLNVKLEISNKRNFEKEIIKYL